MADRMASRPLKAPTLDDRPHRTRRTRWSAASEWLAYGLMSTPADRAEAEAGVREAYELAGLAAPARLLWCDSPLAGARAARQLTADGLRPARRCAPGCAPGRGRRARAELTAPARPARLGPALARHRPAELAAAHRAGGQPAARPGSRSELGRRPADAARRRARPARRGLARRVRRRSRRWPDWPGWPAPPAGGGRTSTWPSSPSGRSRCTGTTWAGCTTATARPWPTRTVGACTPGAACRSRRRSRPSCPTLTVERIRAEANAEVRRVMLEHFGFDRYLRDSGATRVHADEFGVLWRVDIPDDEPLTMVEVVNSTPEPDGSRPHLLPARAAGHPDRAGGRGLDVRADRGRVSAARPRPDRRGDAPGGARDALEHAAGEDLVQRQRLRCT